MAISRTEKDVGHHGHNHGADKHDHTAHGSKEASCCSSDQVGAIPAAPPPENSRSFQVNGLDCAEEVSILLKLLVLNLAAQSILRLT